MSEIIAKSSDIQWPSNKTSTIPYALYTDTNQYHLEREKIFKGPTWNYLCLAAELPEPGTYFVSRIGETPIIVTRDLDGELNAVVNRCSHRGSLLCLKKRGKAENLTCVYHAWSFDLKGNLDGVAFQRGIKRQGGMPDTFCKGDHNLRKLKVVEFCGLVFGSFSEDVPEIEDYLGPEVSGRIKRVLKKPLRVLGHNTQVLKNNWKLYFENAKDSYHASILHTFFTTFEINRLNQVGGIIVDSSGGNHVSYSMVDPSISNEVYGDQQIRSAKEEYRLADGSLLESVDEFGDGITLQILTVFPGLVLQQIHNAIAVRQIVPTSVDTTDLVWTYIGFEDDDEEMIQRRLKQANLVGPAGLVSMEDGAVGNFVQRGIAGTDEDAGVVMMGGETAESQPFRATETSVRGFWKKYRTLMEGEVPNA